MVTWPTKAYMASGVPKDSVVRLSLESLYNRINKVLNTFKKPCRHHVWSYQTSPTTRGASVSDISLVTKRLESFVHTCQKIMSSLSSTKTCYLAKQELNCMQESHPALGRSSKLIFFMNFIASMRVMEKPSPMYSRKLLARFSHILHSNSRQGECQTLSS